mmetsp:Transcript_101699/g.180620  ORF Transcript_101699/g.180620 Transcript_101699/m.180620 type:complete len:278 (-) Transcript_101699:134-967(-)|eukprot:CAMPEP_0197623394 /NCGR_PEP_ID=MMETSP1338-20131121/3418_1 /TAXON_ID=43686 ORGANISM="Pelagodinium beii, Strain RCC1491" /NCGR_SAMPLE_ID=MMETSP1338 /ASSEMBLY_ACC=CAM_ASM_000754 /LENGTH=277 /DNA_ID=CAMNT_0043193357 /DNA_START=26 /DNA_END=859 /DNA_ORIENTATION=+
MSTLDVDIYTMGGRRLSLEMPGESTVLELKLQVAKLWSVGQDAQQMSTTEILKNWQVLGDLPHEPILEVWLLTKANVVSKRKLAQFEDLMAGFESLDSRERLGALRNVKLLANQDDTAEMQALMDMIARRAMDTFIPASSRRFSIESLTEFATKMREGTAKAVTKCLEDNDELVRLTAAEVLPRLCPGDCHVLRNVRGLLKHRNAAVRCASVMAFAEMAKQKELRPCERSEAARDGLCTDCCCRPQKEIIEAVNALYEKDTDPCVQEAALDALRVLL